MSRSNHLPRGTLSAKLTAAPIAQLGPDKRPRKPPFLFMSGEAQRQPRNGKRFLSHINASMGHCSTGLGPSPRTSPQSVRLAGCSLFHLSGFKSIWLRSGDEGTKGMEWASV